MRGVGVPLPVTISMSNPKAVLFLAVLVWCLAHCQSDIPQTYSQEKPHEVRKVEIVGNDFVVDGRPLRILSGSLHYFRLPAAYWRDRLRKLKAAGLNSVSTYVEWSYHEPEERQYLFEGDRDLVKFVQIAAEEGLYVLLRPGPYICAERDLGGFPYWLLSKYPNIRLRTPDQDYMHESRIWFNKLFTYMEPLLYGNGGPIILVQVENEYGSYGKDKVYMGLVRDLLKEHVGDKAILYTTDGFSYSCTSGYFIDGSISGTLTTIDFGTGLDVKRVFDVLRCYMPTGPLMNSEFYPGWLTHWGESQQTISTEKVTSSLRSMLIHNGNVNFYMFFGGSNFEFTAGANYIGTYLADITSYDYDAPLTEAGDPTPKYYAIRDVLKEYDPELENIPAPVPAPKGKYGTIKVIPKINLFSNEGRTAYGKKYQDFTGSNLPTFEALRQRGGFVLYETTIESSGLLYIEKPRDRIHVFVNGEFQGILSRTEKLLSLPLISEGKFQLSLLVENQGRINYGVYIHDFKGILSTVKINDRVVDGKWTITGFPLEMVPDPEINSNEVAGPQFGPVLYQGSFKLPNGVALLDTYIDTSGWGKGFIWINGNNLGRYWPKLGPQVTMYVPGVWLKAAPAENDIKILELEQAPAHLTLESIDYAILNSTAIN